MFIFFYLQGSYMYLYSTENTPFSCLIFLYRVVYVERHYHTSVYFSL